MKLPLTFAVSPAEIRSDKAALNILAGLRSFQSRRISFKTFTHLPNVILLFSMPKSQNSHATAIEFVRRTGQGRPVQQAQWREWLGSQASAPRRRESALQLEQEPIPLVAEREGYRDVGITNGIYMSISPNDPSSCNICKNCIPSDTIRIVRLTVDCCSPKSPTVDTPRTRGIRSMLRMTAACGFRTAGLSPRADFLPETCFRHLLARQLSTPSQHSLFGETV